MMRKNDSALKVAEFLLQIKAVVLKPNDPFTWASGWKSPIYCDNRKTLSYPEIRTYIRQVFCDEIINKYGKPDLIAGVATGGIAIGALIAQELGVSFCYVRSSAKGHGLTNLVEGVVEKGQSVVIIEDLISTGKSSLKAFDALKEVGLDIKGMAAIFTYGFEISEENFKTAKCDLITLTDYSTLLEKGVENNYISDADVKSLNEWRENPSEWKQ